MQTESRRAASAWPQAAADAAPGSFASAKTCATCHATIHTYWSESAHAQAATRPAYLQGLAAVVDGAADKEATRKACLWCHAPTALVTGDYALERPLTREGVTCDFCHAVADVDLGKPGHPFELLPGDVKRGPLEYAKPTSHATEYSPLHRSSPLLCAACHEYRNSHGAPVLTTYSDWKGSPYPERGMLCQECHMPLVPGGSVREGLPASERVINLHRMVGGSGEGQLRRGLDLRIESLTRTATTAQVEVRVTNVRVGHAVPGGLPTKRLVVALGVESASGQLLHRRERVYKRDLIDERGRVLTETAELFLKAVKAGEDSRIRPKDSRTERFTFPVPESARAIVARLEYLDTSDPGKPTTTLVAEERRELPGR
jgi:hypothetical protein